MAQELENKIIKGFTTEQGKALYDYESLYGKPDIPKMIDDALKSLPSGTDIVIDETLEIAGAAADAKVVGDIVKRLDQKIGEKTVAEQIEEAINEIEAGVQIELDNTLTESGKAADAKAVGDAINELANVYAPKSHRHEMDEVNDLSSAIEDTAAQTLSAAKAYTNEQLAQFNPSVQVVVDKTLTVENAAADAKATGEAINQLAAGVAYIDEEDNEIITLNYPSAEGVGF